MLGSYTNQKGKLELRNQRLSSHSELMGKESKTRNHLKNLSSGKKFKLKKSQAIFSNG